MEKQIAKDRHGECERCGIWYAEDICEYVEATAEYVCPVCMEQTEQQVEHAPLPWVIGSSIQVVDAAGGYICGNSRSGTDQAWIDEGNANMAYIVKAANCHDELVAAMEQLIRRITTPHGPVYQAMIQAGCEGMIGPLVKECRAILTKAGKS